MSAAIVLSAALMVGPVAVSASAADATDPAAPTADPAAVPAADGPGVTPLVARTITVRKAGDRLGAAATDGSSGLGGATFAAYGTGTLNTTVIPAGAPYATCVTSPATGTCTLNVDSASPGPRYLVVEQSAPATPANTWRKIDNIALGAYNAAGTNRPYRWNVTVANANATVPTTSITNNSQTGQTWPNRSDGSAWRWADARVNPELPANACGLDIALVFDLSGSVGSTGMMAMKNAANDFVTKLTGTPTRMAVFNFATLSPAQGNTNQPALMPLANATGPDSAATVHGWINALSVRSTDANGLTNWDDALREVANASQRYDMVLMLTDGNPTVWAQSDKTINAGSTIDDLDVEEAIHSANWVKSKGTRIVAAGIAGSGGLSATNLQAISGTVAGSDYFITNFADLGLELAQLALAGCGGVVNVQKRIADTWTGIDDVPLQGNWPFTAAQAYVNPGSASTGTDGSPAQFRVSFVQGELTRDVTITENPSGYILLPNPNGNRNALCTSNGVAVPTDRIVNVANGFTITGVTVEETIACMVVNRPQPTVTLRKSWVDGAAGDTSVLTVTGGTGATATSTSNGAAGTVTDTTNVATSTVAPGTSVTVGEVLGSGNTGSYTPTLACDNATLIGETFTMPDDTVTCTYTNTRTSALMTLQKTWVNGASGDTAVLSITGGTGGTPNSTSTSTGVVGTQTDTTNVATRTVLSGETVSLTEVLGDGNTGSYTTGLVCVPPTGLVYTAGTLAGSFTMPKSPVAVTCTFTNTRTSNGVTLRKEWNNGAGGDTTILTITGGSGGTPTNTSTASGTAGSQLDTTNVATRTVQSGDQVTVTEALGAGNVGGYTESLACSNGVVPDPGGTFAMPNTAVTCTITNTRTSATIALQKEWVNGATNDTAALTITGGSGGTPARTSTATGAAGSQIDTTNVATATVLSGQTVSLAEVLSTDNAGSYTTTLVCEPPAGLEYETGELTGSFTMPKTAAPVTCTFTNTRTSDLMTLRKAWVDGAEDDTSALTITGGTGGTPNSTSTATGASGTQLDETNVATRTVFSGEAVSLAEVLGDGNAGSYTTTLVCEPPAGLTYTAGALTGSFTMPKTPAAVTCTFTNTRTVADLTLQKVWVNSITGDTADLGVDGSTDGDAISTAPDVPVAANSVTVPVRSGETVALTETLGAGNAGTYGTNLVCTPGDGLSYTAGDLSGSFTMPKTATAVVCEFTNTLQAVGLTITKAVVNPDGFAPLPPFTVDVVCTVGDTTLNFNDLPVAPGAPAVVSAVPTGAECTVTEDSLTDPPNWTWSTPAYVPPGGALTITAQGPNTVAVTNTITRNTAQLLLVKDVEAPADPAEWTMTATSPGAPGYSAAGDATAPQTIWSGVEYQLGESGPVGFLAGDWSCVDDGGNDVPVTAGHVTVAAGSVVTCQITNTAWDPQLVLEKTTTTNSFVAAGDEIDYTYTATNLGNVDLTNVQITDDVLGGVLGDNAGTCTIGGTQVAIPTTLAANGGVLVCTWTYTTTAADVETGRVTNVAKASGNDPGDDPVDSNEDTVTVPKAELTLIKVTDPDPSSFAQVGDTVSYSLIATNTGGVPLTDVEIIDPKLGALTCAQPVDLEPGESLTCTGSYTVMQEDVDAGSVLNTATATGNDPDGDPVEDSDDATVLKSAISLDKVGTPATGLEPGDTVTYTFTATNTGGTTLTNVVITDTSLPGLQLDSDCATPTTLTPGQTKVCEGTYTVIQADVDAGAINNTATTTGTGPNNTPVSDDDDETVTPVAPDAEITLDKTAAPTEVTAAGETVTYTFVVTNTGNVTLTNVAVVDTDLPDLGPLVCDLPSPVTLAPDDVLTCTAPYIVTQADIDSGLIANTATAVGTPPSGEDVSDDDPATVTAAASPGIGIVKLVWDGVQFQDANDPTGPFLRSDTPPVFQFVVTNTGNVTLGDLTLTDEPAIAEFFADQALTTACAIPASLAPAGTFTCYGSLPWAAGQQEDTATATGTFDGAPESASDPANYFGADPDISLTKVADLDLVSAPGQVITYTFTATNEGNVPLANVRIVDTGLTGLGPLTCSPEQGQTLANNGDQMVCTAQYTVIQDDLDAGSIPNTATVRGEPPVGPPVTDEGEETVPVVLAQLTVVKNVPAFANLPNLSIPDFQFNTSAQLGGGFTLNGRDDAGTPSAENVRQFTNLSAPQEVWVEETGVVGDEVLRAFWSLESLTCVDGNGAPVGQIEGGSRATLDLNPGDDITCTFFNTLDLNPGISLEKSAIPGTVLLGGTVTYTLEVTNTGNVPLLRRGGDFGGVIDDPVCTPITFDSQASAAFDWDGDPSTLLPAVPAIPSAGTAAQPAEKWIFTCVKTPVTADDVDPETGEIVNTAIARVPNPLSDDPDDPGNDLTDQDDAIVGVLIPGIALAKTVDQPLVSPGTEVTYTYHATNPGSVPLADVTLTDDKCPTVTPVLGDGVDTNVGDTNADGRLDPGEDWVYTCTMAITATTTNVATVTGTPRLDDGQTGAPISASDDALVEVAGIAVDKSASATTVEAGTTVTFSYAVTNTGDVPLANITLTDDKCSPVQYKSGDANGDSRLDVSETWLFTCATAVTEKTTNTATVTGTTPGGETVTSQDKETVQTTPPATGGGSGGGGQMPGTGGPGWTRLAVFSGLALVLFGVITMLVARRRQSDAGLL